MILEIPGRPVAKQRPRLGSGGVYTPTATRIYEETVAWYAKLERHTFLVPIAVRLELWSETALRGDIDNYAKSILDGLQLGGLIWNDSLVQSLHVQFVVGSENKVVVRIEEIEVAA